MFGTLRVLSAAFALTITAPVFAQDVILTLSGKVATPESGETWQFDLADLQALPTAKFETTTIWTEGKQAFEGVPLVALLDHVGASGKQLRAVALNDYAVTIPIADAVEGGPIVAYMRNGAEMSVRDKGPLWIVYPYDDNETYKSEEFYSRSVWQLDRIVVGASN